MEHDFDYSDYSPENFKDTKYMELSQLIINIIKNPKNQEKAKAILENGGFDDFSVNRSTTYMRNNPILEEKKRIGMAWLLANNPETFEYIKDNHISAFHGTNSAALSGIIANGLNSIQKIQNEGGKLVSGEEWSMKYREGEKSNNFVSVTNDLDTAADYSLAQTRDKTTGNPLFSVIIGINEDVFNKLHLIPVGSNYVEAGVKDGIPTDLISFIGVPKDKVQLVKKMVGEKNIAVMPMDFKDRFYSFFDGDISYSKEKAENFNKKEPIISLKKIKEFLKNWRKDR